MNRLKFESVYITNRSIHKQGVTMKTKILNILLSAVLATSVVAAESAKIKTPESSSGVLDISLAHEAVAATKRGMDWLAAHQNKNGSWSNPDFPALTALSLWPFLLSEHPEKERVVNKAVEFLKSNVQKDGGIYKDIKGVKGGGLSNYNTAICMTVLHATGNPDLVKIVQDARKFVAGAQHLGGDEYKGGFGYDKDTNRAYTDLLNTFYAVEAMKATESVEDLRPKGENRVDIDWSETVKFIERMQNKADAGADQEGGFFYKPGESKAGTTTNDAGKIVFRSYASMTYVGMLALMYADVSREDVRIQSAMDWASKHWSLEENPGMGSQGLFFFYNIISKCMNAMNRETIPTQSGETIKWREQLADKIISVQKIDPETGHGYWINENNRFWESDQVLSTAYALLALQLASGETYVK